MFSPQIRVVVVAVIVVLVFYGTTALFRARSVKLSTLFLGNLPVLLVMHILSPVMITALLESAEGRE